jgi:tetratricopeptide (TPR) repeat protein
LDDEHHNITAVLEQSLSNNDTGNEHALRLCAVLWKFWYTRGYFSVARNWLDKATVGQTSEPNLLWGKAIQGKGVIARVQNKPAEAAQYSQEALDLHRQLNDIGGQAHALGELGINFQALGDMGKAATYLDESIALARQLDNPHSLSFSLNARGVIHHLEGDLEPAKVFYLEALATGRKEDDKAECATALVNLGEISAAEGKIDEAYSYYRESLELYGKLGLKLAIAYCIEILAGLETQRGRPSKAAMLFGTADFIREELDAPIEKYNQQRMGNDLQLTRNAMADEEFETNWHFGRGLNIESVLGYVLSE